MKIDLPGNILLFLLLSPAILAVSKTARSGKNPFKQSLQNPTPVMTAVWRVFLLLFIVEAVSVASIFITQFGIYDGMFPTVPDALHAHRTQVMGHRAYLSDFLDWLYAGMLWASIVSICVGFVAFCIYTELTEREKERRHDIRIAWMKSRPE